MNVGMASLGKWLRPPRNLLVIFIFVVGVPAVTLLAFGIRLLEQDKALAHQREVDLLDRAADQGVRLLEQDLAGRIKRLSSPACTPVDVPYDSVCVALQTERINVFPPERIPYYPFAQQLKEIPSEPFVELESNEFREPVHLDKALEISRTLAASKDSPIRAGALLREARILRKMGKTNEALAVFADLSHIASVSINHEPADLLARRTRCGILEELSRTTDLRTEAASIASDLHAGKWQLDRESFLHIDEKLRTWLGAHGDRRYGDDEALAVALNWLYEKWTTRTAQQSASNGVYVLNSDGRQVTIVWAFANGHDAAFIAGPQYLASHWLAAVQKAVEPAQVSVSGINAPQPGAVKVQRSAAETGLPWTILVSNPAGQQEPPEFAARRRNLAVGLAVLVMLIASGSYFIWRAVNRELAVARLQSDFVSAVSHEFRTPLTTLRQFNELLAEDDGPTPEKRRTFYQAQSRATERLHRLVESLLDFGRMEAGRRPYHFTPMDAATFAQDVTKEFERETNGLGFLLQCSCDDGPHPISADAESLSRALWNLLDNAVKYSGSSRDIQVGVSRANGSVSIAVRDHGIGIPASEQKAVFQKFVRGAASTSGGIRGTGLGLAMVRHIVEAHAGVVKLESAEGKGSTFTIVLPANGKEDNA
jgi:signal transduction histidine kinase